MKANGNSRLDKTRIQMNPKDFENSPTGRLVPTENSQLAFLPNPLPAQGLSLDSISALVAEAHLLLGQLAGVGRQFKNPYLLVRPLQRKEAVASSSIEGTYTTLNDLLLFEVGADESSRPADTREVLNYVRALEYALNALGEIPISTRMITEMHKILLTGLPTIRGGKIVPGEYKRMQNYIGGTIKNVRFIPPPPTEVHQLMSNLETFLNSEESKALPPLVLAAQIHYQFETIHPFPDGNGRVGRLLIPLVLKQVRALEQPLLYISPVIEERKDEYIERLLDVSRTGNWVGWIQTFLEIVSTTCRRTIDTIEKLHDLNQDYRRRVGTARTSALLGRLVDEFFEMPAMSIPQAAEKCHITYPSAKNHLERLRALGILNELESVRRPRYFIAQEVVDILIRS